MSIYESRATLNSLPNPASPTETYPLIGGDLVVAETSLSGDTAALVGSLGQTIERYHVATVGMGTLHATQPELPQPLGEGAEGKAYDLIPGSNIVTKIVPEARMSTLKDPVFVMMHMEQLRLMLEWLIPDGSARVPRHYAVYLPHGGSYYALLLEQVMGYNLNDVLNGAPHVPEEYTACGLDILLAYDNFIRRTESSLSQGAYSSHDHLEDIKPANVIVRKDDEVKGGYPFSFWLIDQVSPGL